MLVSSLKGLVFVSDPNAVRSEGVDASGIVTSGIEMLNRQSFREDLLHHQRVIMRAVVGNDRARDLLQGFEGKWLAEVRRALCPSLAETWVFSD